MDPKVLMDKLGHGQIEGGRQAIEDSLANGIAVIYLDDADRLVREHSDGHTEILDDSQHVDRPWGR